MGLRIYNTLNRKKEPFIPETDKEVKIYVCGPTVNDLPHLGHARQQITFDILRKYLRFLGYNVRFVSNVTDVDDKIINKANESGEDINVLTEKNLRAHLEDYRRIGVQEPDVQPRATEYIPEMIDLIKKLEQKGFTYVLDRDGVYYDTSRFKDYGKLSHQKLERLITGKRKALTTKKKNEEDFVLWKFSKENEPSWDSPWGRGRPGWHIECSAMSASILGLPLDIHGGGQDLIFPHHEDEIAQSEIAYGEKLANYWVHNGMVNVEKIKMSKSLGNFKTIRDLLKNYGGEVIRFFVLSSHYRKPIDFSEDNLDNANKSYERLINIASSLDNDGRENRTYLNKFEQAMNDDLNTSKAISVIWKLLRDKKATGKYVTISKMDEVFCLNLLKKTIVKIPKEIENLVKAREEARKNKNWKLADSIRGDVFERGWQIEDALEGPSLKKK